MLTFHDIGMNRKCSLIVCIFLSSLVQGRLSYDLHGLHLDHVTSVFVILTYIYPSFGCVNYAKFILT